jgi:putative protease
MKKVGTVTHFYGKIGVAIIELSAGLKVGDKVKIGTETDNTEEVVSSMQVEHAEIQEAKAGDVIGLKVSAKVHEGASVFKE